MHTKNYKHTKFSVTTTNKYIPKMINVYKNDYMFTKTYINILTRMSIPKYYEFVFVSFIVFRKHLSFFVVIFHFWFAFICLGHI